MPMPNKINNRGFSLVEIAIVVVIIGFIFAPLMAVFIQRDQDQQQALNVDNDERIAKAIHFFVKRNGRYPCPADMGKQPSDADFGRENVAASGSCVRSRGALPVTTLGIPVQLAVNIHGWKYKYGVSPKLARTDTLAANAANGKPTLRVYNAVNASGQATGAFKLVPFVIINVGIDGKGSETLYGEENSLACVIDAGDFKGADVENCESIDDQHYLDIAENMQVNPEDQLYFDDRLTYGSVGMVDDLWIMRRSDATPDQLAVSNRNAGHIGIGFDLSDPSIPAKPEEQLHINHDVPGEDAAIIEADFDGSGGDVDVYDRDVNVADKAILKSNLNVDTTFKAGRFCIGSISGESCSDAKLDIQIFNAADGSYSSRAGSKCEGLLDGDASDGTTCCKRYELGRGSDGKLKCCSNGRDNDGKCKAAK